MTDNVLDTYLKRKYTLLKSGTSTSRNMCLGKKYLFIFGGVHINIVDPLTLQSKHTIVVAQSTFDIYEPMCISPCDKYLLYVNADGYWVYSIKEETLGVRVTEGRMNGVPIRLCYFGHKSDFFLASSMCIRRYDIVTGKRLMAYSRLVPSIGVGSNVVDREGAVLYSYTITGFECSLAAWDVATGKHLREKDVGNFVCSSKLTNFAFANAGMLGLYESRTDAVHLFDAASFAYVTRLPPPRSRFGYTDSYVAFCNLDIFRAGRVFVHDILPEDREATDDAICKIQDVSISPDGSLMALQIYKREGELHVYKIEPPLPFVVMHSALATVFSNGLISLNEVSRIKYAAKNVFEFTRYNPHMVDYRDYCHPDRADEMYDCMWAVRENLEHPFAQQFFDPQKMMAYYHLKWDLYRAKRVSNVCGMDIPQELLDLIMIYVRYLLKEDEK